MYALTSSMKGTTCRRFANMVCKKVDVKVCSYSSHALDMKLNDDDLNKIRDRTPNLSFQASSTFSVNSRCNLNPHARNLSTVAASFVGDNTSATTTAVLPVDNAGVARIGEVKRVKKIERNVSVKINLDGSGIADSDSGIPYLDGMIHEFASHGLFDIHVKATGDIDYDVCRTNEEVAKAIGTALQQAFGGDDRKKGINRIGNFIFPHEDAVIQVSLDLSGGDPHLDFFYTEHMWHKTHDTDSLFNTSGTESIGTYDIESVEQFFKSLVDTSGMTLHIRRLSGKNSLNVIEAIFKAFAGAFRQAIEYDPRRRPLLLDGTLPTSK